ncbi:MAG: GAF domain-containing protein [bacterium]
MFKETDRVKLKDHYCEKVINSKEKLRVDNALEEKEWREAPELEHDLTAYLGLPILWPNGDVFGTICVHGKKGSW